MKSRCAYLRRRLLPVPRVASLVAGLVLVAVGPTGLNGQPAPSAVQQAALPIPLEFLGVVAGSDVSDGAVRWLEDAIRGELPRAGFATLTAAPLGLVIRVSSRSMGESDAGMRRIVMQEVAVTFTLGAGANTAGLASTRLTRTGSGRDAAAATQQALSQLVNEASTIADAIAGMHDQASRGFEALCDDVLSSARRLAEDRSFDAAIGITMSVPLGAPRCRARARTLSHALYQQRAAYQCGAALQRARAARAAGRLGEALAELRYVDPLSPCHQEIGVVIAQVAADAAERNARDAAERAEALRQAWAFRSAALKAATTVERQRLVVMGQIAEALLRR